MDSQARPLDDDSLSERIAATTQRLAVEFGGYFSPQAIEEVTRQSLQSYERATVMDFVPLFVERYTRARLRASIGETR
jgi:hypothetical protein